MTSAVTTISRPTGKSSAMPSEPSTTHQRILVVEDNDDAGESLQKLLETALGVSVDLVADGVRALEMLTESPYSVVITDLRLPNLSGMDLLREVQNKSLPVTVIVTTGHGSIDEAVEAMRIGAYDFLTKPPDPEHLCLLVQRALRERSLQDELVALRAQLQDRRSFQNVISKNPRMLADLRAPSATSPRPRPPS